MLYCSISYHFVLYSSLYYVMLSCFLSIKLFCIRFNRIILCSMHVNDIHMAPVDESRSEQSFGPQCAASHMPPALRALRSLHVEPRSGCIGVQQNDARVLSSTGFSSSFLSISFSNSSTKMSPASRMPCSCCRASDSIERRRLWARGTLSQLA